MREHRAVMVVVGPPPKSVGRPTVGIVLCPGSVCPTKSCTTCGSARARPKLWRPRGNRSALGPAIHPRPLRRCQQASRSEFGRQCLSCRSHISPLGEPSSSCRRSLLPVSPAKSTVTTGSLASPFTSGLYRSGHGAGVMALRRAPQALAARGQTCRFHTFIGRMAPLRFALRANGWHSSQSTARDPTAQRAQT